MAFRFTEFIWGRIDSTGIFRTVSSPSCGIGESAALPTFVMRAHRTSRLSNANFFAFCSIRCIFTAATDSAVLRFAAWNKYWESRVRVMANKDYLKRLQLAIQELHKCKATHRRTVRVHEVIEDKQFYDGDVEVFWLTDHPSAKRCFAWSQQEDSDKSHEHIIAILEIPPVIGPATAVRVANQSPLP